jgi:hypothetical protein
MPNFPGMSAMTDTLDFMKNLWGGMNIPGMSGMPGMVMPTLSVEEINKQISDLKAVESWLNLNMNMLRSTIQALEVQSATISTLQSMSETLSAAIKPDAAKAAPAAKPEAPYSSFAQAPEKPAPEPAATKASTAAPSFNEAADSVGGAGLANPAIWWNMLQDQFKQAVDTALATEKPEAASKAAPAASKPATKKSSTPRKRAAPKSPANK